MGAVDDFAGLGGEAAGGGGGGAAGAASATSPTTQRKRRRDALQQFRESLGLRCIYLTYAFEPRAAAGLALSAGLTSPFTGGAGVCVCVRAYVRGALLLLTVDGVAIGKRGKGSVPCRSPRARHWQLAVLHIV